MEKFLLYKSYVFVKKYKLILASFSNVSLFINETPIYKKGTVLLDLRKIFRLFSVQLTNHTYFFTYASKNDSSRSVGVAFVSPHVNIERIYKTRVGFSVFSGNVLL